MTIAELFVNIGVKGGENAKKALTQVSEGMGGITSSSLAAKAGILAVIYGVEQFMTHSAQSGMALQQFSAFTGLSTDALQRWQYAARQSGVSAEEMAGSIKGVQAAIGQMQLGKGPPGGIGIIAQYTGGFDSKKINDTFYLFEKLKQFAKNAAVPKQFGNEFLKSFGLSENVIQFLRTTEIQLDKIKPSNIFSGGEISKLAAINVAWENLGAKMKMAFGHLTSKHGSQIVNELAKIADQVIRMTDGFTILAEKLKIFEAIGLVFEGWGHIFNGLNSLLPTEKDNKRDKNRTSLREDLESLPGMFLETIKGLTGSADPSPVPKLLMGPHKTPDITPAMRLFDKSTPSQNTTINQTITHHGDAKDTHAVAETHKKVIRDAARQLQSQKQVN